MMWLQSLPLVSQHWTVCTFSCWSPTYTSSLGWNSQSLKRTSCKIKMSTDKITEQRQEPHLPPNWETWQKVYDKMGICSTNSKFQRQQPSSVILWEQSNYYSCLNSVCMTSSIWHFQAMSFGTCVPSESLMKWKLFNLLYYFRLRIYTTVL